MGVGALMWIHVRGRMPVYRPPWVTYVLFGLTLMPILAFVVVVWLAAS